MLEYGVSVAAVAVGWGQYLNEFLSSFNLEIPPQFANPPGEYGGSGCPPGFDHTTWVGDLPDKCAAGVFNIPSLLVVVLCGLLLIRGTSESARVNTVMVFLKLAILGFFCVIAFTEFDPSNLTPFLPLGMAGVSAAASQVFFSYIGFDAASTAGEEAKNPRRDLPRAIILSLIIVTVCYLLVTLAAIGARPWEDFEGTGGDAVLASIARDVTGSDWAPAVIALGAVISIFSVVLTVMYGQTRILFAMGRDGLLPSIFTRVNPRTMALTANTWIVTVIIGILAALVPLGQLAEATSIGTLFAFAIVNVGVIVLRRTRPDLPRSFRTPLFPITPILGIVFIVWVMSGLAGITWLVFALWMLLGLVIYFAYSYRHSKLRLEGQPSVHAPDA
jgi:APA family basic amino acid/polyamine antiporter